MPRRPKHFKTFIFAALAVVLVAILSIAYSVWLCFRPMSDMTEPVSLSIETGDTLNVIATKIRRLGLVPSAQLFKVYAYIIGQQSKFQAGEYSLEPPFSIARVIWELTDAPGRFQDRRIVVFEGWNNWNIVNSLETQGFARAKEFLALQTSMEDELNQRYDFLAARPRGVDFEGYLFPDTYYLSRNISPEQILIKMLDNFALKLTPEIRAEIDASGHSLHEILTMASVIEREVSIPEDRRLVSGVFWNRLDIGMALQSDATVNYVNATRTTRPSLDDLKTDSLYNTYRYKGLPPGPICNPSLDAILAALRPTESDYIYFLSTATGKTIFSRTYQEHLVAKYKYLD